MSGWQGQAGEWPASPSKGRLDGPIPLSHSCQPGESLCARFEQQVATQPEALAVRCGHDELSYRGLNPLANRIACEIVAHRGPQPEPVALLLEKSVCWVAALLAVLKARKFFVPLDSSFPGERLAEILADTNARLIVVDSVNRITGKRLASAAGTLLVTNDFNSSTNGKNLGHEVSATDLAWIIYTSGSTGRPKGVMQKHRNVVKYVADYKNYFGICPRDRLTHLFSTSVNGGAHDVFAALLDGASLHLFDLRQEGVGKLPQWLIDAKITIYCSAPTVFIHLVAELNENANFPRLRLVRLIGEPVYKSHVDLFRRHFSDDCVLVNRLGSPETGSLLFHFSDNSSTVDGELVPVGFPVEGNEVLLLDETGCPVANDEVGKIAVRSSYLSPGYWRRRDLTATAFVGCHADGSHLYRTGDLGRRLSGGSLVHLGRTDFQIKVKGFRVELAEVEAALNGIDSVKDAVVMPYQDGDTQQLAGYVVSTASPAPSSMALRKQLLRTLPNHMVPLRFVFIEALPQTANGKVDRRALPSPLFSDPRLDEAPFAEPRDPLEATLAVIWANVLRHERVGIHDDFLALGGDSLLASRLVARLRSSLKVDMQPGFLLRAATIADMARTLRSNPRNTIDPAVLAEVDGIPPQRR